MHCLCQKVEENISKTGPSSDRCEADWDPSPTQSAVWADLSLRDAGARICG